MYRTRQQLITPTRCACLIVSIGIHAVLFGVKRGDSPASAQIEFQQGVSVVELTLLPAVSRNLLPPVQPATPPPPLPEQIEPDTPPLPVQQKPDTPPIPEHIEPLPPIPVLPKPDTPPLPEQIEPLPPEKSLEPVAETPRFISANPTDNSIEQDADLEQKGIESSATLEHRVVPSYPRLSRRRNEEGTVIIALSVTSAGLLEDIRIQRSSGYVLLDQAALKAIQKSRFKPAMKNGRPIRESVEQSFVFRLENKNEM